MACEFDFANAAFSIVTIAASGFVGFFSARRISTLNTYSLACATFRAALAPVCVELRKANGKPTNSLDSTLSATLHNVAVAFEVFSPFVSDAKRTSYEAAWHEYQEAATLGSEFMYTDDGVAEVRRRVKKLLSHA